MSPKKKTKEETEAKRIAAEKAAKKAEAEAKKAADDARKAEEKARKKREKEEKERKEKEEAERNRIEAEEAKRQEDARLTSINTEHLERDWLARRSQDHVLSLKQRIKSLIESTKHELEAKEQLMELLASQYDEGSAFADDQRRAHLANLAQLEALTSKEIETERSYFLEKDGEMLRRVYAGSAGKLAVWTSETLDAMRSEQVGWTESFATKRGRDEDDWLSITEQRRESILQTYHTSRLSLLSHITTIRTTAVALAQDHEASTGLLRRESEIMFSKLSSLQAEVERVREKEDKVKNGIGVLTRKLEGVHKARVEGVRAQIEKLGVDAVPPSLRKKISDILGVEVISACDAGSGKETVDAVDGEIAELRKKVAEVSGRVMALKARVSVRR